MSAIERARADEKNGDLGSARRRLKSYLRSKGYDVAVCEQIAALSDNMSDPIEAGRWLLCKRFKGRVAHRI